MSAHNQEDKFKTHQEAADMVCIPQKNINSKPLQRSWRVFPSVNGADIHCPSLPRSACEYYTLDVMLDYINIIG